MTARGVSPKLSSSRKDLATPRGSVKSPPAGGVRESLRPGVSPPPGAPLSFRPPGGTLNKSVNPRAASTERVGSKVWPGQPDASAPRFAARAIQQQPGTMTGPSPARGPSALTRPQPPAARPAVPHAGKQPISSSRKGDSIQPMATWYWRAASVGLLGIPYLFDYYRSHQAQVYENTHGGYHSVERHDAWYRPANMLKRTLKHPKKKKLSQMVNWQGGNVPHYKVSSQFATDNWQLYSIGQGEEHLKQLDKNAVIDQNQAAPWVAGHDFTIKYTGWTTGWSYDAANPNGQSCEYIYYNYSKDPANPTHYFLGQHFPKTAAAATNFTVSTWRLI